MDPMLRLGKKIILRFSLLCLFSIYQGKLIKSLIIYYAELGLHEYEDTETYLTKSILVAKMFNLTFDFIDVCVLCVPAQLCDFNNQF